MLIRMAGIAEAKNIKNEALSSKQQSIIPIATFTARGIWKN